MYRISPIGRKSNFHSREKCLIGLVLVTLCFLCFGGIFLLPDNFGSDRVLRVYKHFRKAGPEIFIPAPPLAAHAPHRSEDPHFIGDRQRLEQKIRAELGDMLDEPPAAGGGEPGQFQVLAQQAQAPAPVAALADQPLDQDEGHAAIPVLAAPVQGTMPPARPRPIHKVPPSSTTSSNHNCHWVAVAMIRRRTHWTPHWKNGVRRSKR